MKNEPRRHFLSIHDLTAAEVDALFRLAAEIKAEPVVFREALAGKTLALIFQKPSTRTRVSFEAGMAQLGGQGLFLSPRDLQLGRGETVAEIGRASCRERG